MEKIQTETQAEDAAKVTALVTKLNRYRHEYYNLAAPSVSDAVYDHLFDELQELEKKTGIILSNSPTQTVGAVLVSSLKKVRHSIPLLSLDKTKQIEGLLEMAARSASLLMLKLDGLTVKLCYEDGWLVEASTRGDGETGEMITHNIPAFYNVPVSIPHKDRLVVTGEGIIHQDDFERMKGEISGADGKGACNARNLAAGSIRLLDPAACRKRHIHFYAFNVIEGMERFGKIADSRGKLLDAMRSLGFKVCPFLPLTTKVSMEELEKGIRDLRNTADDRGLPIDGMVLRYDSLSYSKGCGRTGHHYKDGIAYKFEDEVQETVFRSVEWTPGRSGEIAPVAVFDTVEIDGCSVSRASLHNISFIRNLELHPGCRILVSKRNMVIPHIEDNLDRGHYADSMIPKKCPCCGNPVRIYARKGGNGCTIETLHCDNPDCRNQLLRKLVHFAGKKAMDISGISKAAIDRFIEKGFLHTCQDFYHLDRYRDEIIRMEGFGERSYEKLQESIEKSRHTTFVRYVVAMDIPLVGRTAGRALDSFFKGNLQEFAKAAVDCFDFTSLTDFGEKMSRSIWDWFHDYENLKLWKTLQKEFRFEEREEENMKNRTENNPFAGCTVVATGKLENFTRDGINSRITSLGATAGSSVTRKTDYLVCGEKPGSKLAKARNSCPDGTGVPCHDPGMTGGMEKMIRLDDGRCIIGFDDGYQLGKTANFIFDNGVHMLGSAEPTLKENSLFYDGEYFKVGEGRAAITEDKVSDDTARLRTMAGIAMELRREGLCKADVILVAGLPFSNYGRDKLKLTDYYNQRNVLDFSYEGEDYSVTVGKVIVCPQCYSAIASRLGNMKGDYLVVDIGSKTTDVVYVQNGFPVESKSITIEKAMVKWMKEIQRDMKVQTGKDIPEHEVMKVLLKEESHLPIVYAELINGMMREKICSLELELAERGYDMDYTNIIYVGGGALMARDHAGKYRSHTAYDCDLCANAKGYEFLVGQMIGKKVG